jgi:hypothetical protein
LKGTKTNVIKHKIPLLLPESKYVLISENSDASKMENKDA